MTERAPPWAGQLGDRRQQMLEKDDEVAFW